MSSDSLSISDSEINYEDAIRREYQKAVNQLIDVTDRLKATVEGEVGHSSMAMSCREQKKIKNNREIFKRLTNIITEELGKVKSQSHLNRSDKTTRNSSFEFVRPNEDGDKFAKNSRIISNESRRNSKSSKSKEVKEVEAGFAFDKSNPIYAPETASEVTSIDPDVKSLSSKNDDVTQRAVSRQTSMISRTPQSRKNSMNQFRGDSDSFEPNNERLAEIDAIKQVSLVSQPADHDSSGSSDSYDPKRPSRTSASIASSSGFLNSKVEYIAPPSSRHGSSAADSFKLVQAMKDTPRSSSLKSGSGFKNSSGLKSNSGFKSSSGIKNNSELKSNPVVVDPDPTLNPKSISSTILDDPTGVSSIPREIGPPEPATLQQRNQSVDFPTANGSRIRPQGIQRAPCIVRGFGRGANAGRYRQGNANEPTDLEVVTATTNIRGNTKFMAFDQDSKNKSQDESDDFEKQFKENQQRILKSQQGPVRFVVLEGYRKISNDGKPIRVTEVLNGAGLFIIQGQKALDEKFSYKKVLYDKCLKGVLPRLENHPTIKPINEESYRPGLFAFTQHPSGHWIRGKIVNVIPLTVLDVDEGKCFEVTKNSFRHLYPWNEQTLHHLADTNLVEHARGVDVQFANKNMLEHLNMPEITMTCRLMMISDSSYDPKPIVPKDGNRFSKEEHENFKDYISQLELQGDIKMLPFETRSHGSILPIIFLHSDQKTYNKTIGTTTSLKDFEAIKTTAMENAIIGSPKTEGNRKELTFSRAW